MATRELKLDMESGGKTSMLSALLLEPPNARLGALIAHGAGAGMRHPFMQSIAESLAARGIASLRYNFPYMELKSGRPDSPAVAEKAVRAAVHAARQALPNLPLIAGGKSFGGRMTSHAAAKEPLDGVTGLFFLGFPLHPPGKPDVKRAEHLANVDAPMLFLQGTRDAFADLTLLEPMVAGLGLRATLHIVNDADHSFAVPKRTGRTNAEVMQELAGAIEKWAALSTTP